MRNMGATYLEGVTPITGTVVKVNPIGPSRRPTVDIIPNDMRSYYGFVPYASPFGVSRMPRLGEQVVIMFPYASVQFPVALGHVVSDQSAGDSQDPLPPPHQNVDDIVLYHPETKAFFRIRALLGSAQAVAPDGTPARWEITTASGATMLVVEHAGASAAPTKATMLLSTPGGFSATLDDIAQQTSLDAPSGAHVTIDEIAQTVEAASSEGHKVLLDDQGKAASVVSAGGHTVRLDDLGRIVSVVTAGGLEHLLDDVSSEVATLTQRYGVGSRWTALTQLNNAINNQHLTSFAKQADLKRLSDEVFRGNQMVIAAAGATSVTQFAARYLAQAQGLVLSTIGALQSVVPTGSSVMRVVS